MHGIGYFTASGVRASLATVWLPVSALLLSVVFLGKLSVPGSGWAWAAWWPRCCWPRCPASGARRHEGSSGQRPTTDQPACRLVLSFSYSQAVPQRSHW